MKLAAPFKGQFVVDLDYLVDQRSIEIFGDKPGSDPLDPMLAGLSATDHRGLLGLDGYGLEIRIEFLDVPCDTRDRSPGSDTRDDRVDIPGGVGPDLRPGGAFVNGRIRWVFKLLRHPAEAVGSDQFVGFGDRSSHPFGRWG